MLRDEEEEDLQQQQLVEDTTENPLLAFARANLLNLVQPDTWYNIPLCVVRAFKSLLDHA